MALLTLPIYANPIAITVPIFEPLTHFFLFSTVLTSLFIFVPLIAIILITHVTPTKHISIFQPLDKQNVKPEDISSITCLY
jgi:hypothetical protein